MRTHAAEAFFDGAMREPTIASSCSGVTLLTTATDPGASVAPSVASSFACWGVRAPPPPSARTSSPRSFRGMGLLGSSSTRVETRKGARMKAPTISRGRAFGMSARAVSAFETKAPPGAGPLGCAAGACAGRRANAPFRAGRSGMTRWYRGRVGLVDQAPRYYRRARARRLTLVRFFEDLPADRLVLPARRRRGLTADAGAGAVVLPAALPLRAILMTKAPSEPERRE